MQTKYPDGPRATFQLFIALIVATAASGCAMRNTTSGGRATSVLGGVMRVESKSFQPPPSTTINVNTSTIVGDNGPSGNRVTFLWGMLTLHDY